jgi:protein-tyrosine phosphatase
MIDLHCHLIPGVDDGPETLEESLTLARLAVKNGIRHSVLTPHVHIGRYPNQRSTLEQAFNDFKVALVENGIELDVSLGGEVRLDPAILGLLEQDEIPMLGSLDGYDVMLLEFPHSHILPGTDKLVQYLLNRNIRPMIAHPERNKDVMRSLEKIEPFVHLGCLFQVTAGSVCGNFGKPAMQRAHEMLERGWVTVLASDAHNAKYRPPDIEPGRRAAEALIGRVAADALVFERPRQILSGT